MAKQDSERNKKYSNLGKFPKEDRERVKKELTKKFKKSTESMQKGKRPEPFNTLFSYDPTYIPTPGSGYKTVGEKIKEKYPGISKKAIKRDLKKIKTGIKKVFGQD